MYIGTMADRIGTLEDVGKSVCVCDVCDYVAWDGGGDGDPCPECEARDYQDGDD